MWSLGIKSKNPYVQFLVSVSRDNKMVVWKLFDGRIMHSDLALPLFFANQEQKAKEKLPLISFRSKSTVENPV
jgi:hypothetical protein